MSNKTRNTSLLVNVGLIGLFLSQYMGFINLFGGNGQKDQMDPPKNTQAHFDGSYLAQMAALQEIGPTYQELIKALKDENNDEGLTIGFEAGRDLVDYLDGSAMNLQNGLLIGPVTCPPFCPPNPCDTVPYGLGCGNYPLNAGVLEGMLFPTTEIPESIVFVDNQGNTIGRNGSPITLEGGRSIMALELKEGFAGEGSIQVKPPKGEPYSVDVVIK